MATPTEEYKNARSLVNERFLEATDYATEAWDIATAFVEKPHGSGPKLARVGFPRWLHGTLPSRLWHLFSVCPLFRGKTTPLASLNA